MNQDALDVARATQRTGRLPGVRRGLRVVRAAWLLAGATLLALVACELFLWGLFTFKDRLARLPRVDPRLVAEGYDGAPWVETHFREYDHLVAQWQPYVYFRQEPFRGQTITVLPGGLRKTWNSPESAHEKPLQIWFLGGSSGWGVGARDDYTIPSLLAKDLSARGRAVDVTNHSEIGYVSTQELLWLALRLRAGECPDLVIAYDGANEILSAQQNGVAGWPQHESNRRDAFDAQRSRARSIVESVRLLVRESSMFRLAKALRARLGGPPESPALETQQPGTSPSLDALAGAVLDTYEANQRLIEALAASYGFDVMFVWQPAIFTKVAATPFERDEINKYAALQPLFTAVYDRVRERADQRRLPPDTLDLSRLFDDDARTRFADFCHLTEASNAIVARALADHVEAWINARKP
jgi:lysophospholipase L1-like esterase